MQNPLTMDSLPDSEYLHKLRRLAVHVEPQVQIRQDGQGL